MLDHPVTIKVLPYLELSTWFHKVPVVQYFLPRPVCVFRSNGDCVSGSVVVSVTDHLEEGDDGDVVDLVDNLEGLDEITSKSLIF